MRLRWALPGGSGPPVREAGWSWPSAKCLPVPDASLRPRMPAGQCPVTRPDGRSVRSGAEAGRGAGLCPAGARRRSGKRDGPNRTALKPFGGCLQPLRGGLRSGLRPSLGYDVLAKMQSVRRTVTCSARFDRQACAPPLRKADVEAARLEPARLQQPNGVVGIDAIGAPAVGDDLSAARQLGRKRRERVQRHRLRAPNVPRLVFGLRPARRAQRRRLAPAAPEAPRRKPARPRPAHPGTRPPIDSPLRRGAPRHRAPPPKDRPPARSQADRRPASPPDASEPDPPEPEHAGAATCSRRSARSRSRSPRPSARPARADRRSPPGGRCPAPALQTRTRRTRRPSLPHLPYSQVIT